MAKSLLEEAFEDARILKQAAIENAKNVLVEAISPKIKQFVESQLGECGPGMDMPHQNHGQSQEIPLILKVMAPGPQDESAMYEDERTDTDKQDVELIKQLGVLAQDPDGDEEAEEPQTDEEDSEFNDNEEDDDKEEDSKEDSSSDDDEDKKDVKEVMSELPEGLEMEAKDKDEKEKDKMDEMVEITNEDLKEALSQVLGSLKKEAKVTKRIWCRSKCDTSSCRWSWRQRYC